MRTLLLLSLCLVQTMAKDNFVKFELDLLKSLASANDQKSVVVSGFSILNSLALAYAGADGQTLKEFEDKLGQKPVDALFKPRLDALLSSNNKFSLELANRAFLDEHLHNPNAGYIAKVKDVYHSGVQRVDLAQKAKAADVINQFVSNVTKGQIKEITKADSIPENAKLVLVNAIHFKAKFRQPFPPSQTFLRTFHVKAGVDKEVPAMHAVISVPYMQDEDVQVIALDYEGGAAKLVLILPKQRFGLDAFLQALDVGALQKYLGVHDEQYVEIDLPRFTLDFGDDLTKRLRGMGLSSGFGSSASFPGISDEQVSIGQLMHKACFKTNETGSEGSAASSVFLQPESLMETNNTFDANHPFAFFVVAKDTIIFDGVVREIHE